MRTGKPGVLAFTGAYHGLTYGALAATWRPEFRAPFRAQLYGGVRFAPYPYVYRWAEQVDGAGGAGVSLPNAEPGEVREWALAEARRLVEEAERGAAPIGAVLVEPVQGRGGIVVPPAGFLEGLRALADELGLVLIFDEVYTGF